jgi:hypothetical protein
MSYDKEKYLKTYHEENKNDFVIYVIKIQREIEANKYIFKIGRTNKWKYRLINLNQSLYDNYTVQFINCCNKDQTCRLERYLLNRLFEKRYNNKKEWFLLQEDEMIRTINEIKERLFLI